MTTIKERFEKFRASSKVNAIKYGRIADWEKKYKADLAFFQQELLALASDLHEMKKSRNFPGMEGGEYDVGLEDAATLIRSKADELL